MRRRKNITRVHLALPFSRSRFFAPALFGLTLAIVLSACGSIGQRTPELAAGSEATAVENKQSKIFTNWILINPQGGPCKSRNAKLILYSDGSQEWEIELLSPSGGVRWDQAFHFYDTGKPDHTWFGSRWGGGFDINYSNIWTYWHHRRGPADLRLATAFDKISYVVWSGAC